MRPVIFATLFALIPTVTHAGMVCGKHADIAKRLESGYQEVRTGIGLAGNGGLIELYVSDKRTFTIVLTRPNGLACLMAVGENWEVLKTPLPVKGQVS